jgi:hypothetical protein
LLEPFIRLGRGAVSPPASWADWPGIQDYAACNKCFVAGESQNLSCKITLIKEGDQLFFEKKNQKTFAMALNSRRILHRPAAAPLAKVFASFFKKKRFPYFLESPT